MDESHDLAISDNVRIQLSEIQFRYSPSRGPGGQHVNRAHTRVTLLFNVLESSNLDETERARILNALSHRLDKRGILRITSQESRSQHRNRQIALARFADLISSALMEQSHRVPTETPASADRRRLDKKKARSRRKQERGRDWSRER